MWFVELFSGQKVPFVQGLLVHYCAVVTVCCGVVAVLGDSRFGLVPSGICRLAGLLLEGLVVSAGLMPAVSLSPPASGTRAGFVGDLIECGVLLLYRQEVDGLLFLVSAG